MFNAETTARLRAVLNEVCKNLSEHETGTRSYVASEILEAAKMGETSVERLEHIGKRALSRAPVGIDD